jgi:diguanylate cyclase (GGDEF)-like protein
LNPPGTSARAGAWQTLLDALADPAWIVDAGDMRVRAVNPAARALLGMDEAALRRAAPDTLLATPEDLAFWEQVRGGESGELNSQTRLVDAAGRQWPVTRRIRRLAAAGNAQYLVTVHDRSEVEREAQARDAALAELQATLESTADGILVTDPAGRIRVFNRRFAQIWGLPEQLLTERNDDAVRDWMRRSVVDPQGYEQRLAAIEHAALAQATEHITLQTGQVLECVTQPQLSGGRPCGRVWAFRDRTELVTAGRRIEVLSTTDALTGLINRRRLGELLAQAIVRVREDKQSLALLLLDLDRFKALNDNLGHEVGDRILLIAAQRLRGCLRPRDHVARTGGDQFALLLPDADVRGAESAALRVLDAVSAPSEVGALRFTITCSIGIALFPADGDDDAAIMRHAETAMKRAKVGGRGGFRFHRPQHESDLRRRMRLDHAMRQALASRPFPPALPAAGRSRPAARSSAPRR